MWELLTGERYWGKTRDLEIVRRLRKGELAPSPDKVNPALPRRVAAICDRALAFARADRYATGADFLSELEGEMKDVHAHQARLAELVRGLFVEERRTLRGIVDEAMLRAGRESMSSLVQILKSGVHSRSDFTILPTTHTAPPASNEEKKQPPFPTGLLVAAALCLALATTLLTLRLPTAGAGATSGSSAGAPASSTSAVPAPAAASKATAASALDAAATIPVDSANPSGGAESKDPDDALPENGEPVYK
jgi:hypothetical protein